MKTLEIYMKISEFKKNQNLKEKIEDFEADFRNFQENFGNCEENLKKIS